MSWRGRRTRMEGGGTLLVVGVCEEGQQKLDEMSDGSCH